MSIGSDHPAGADRIYAALVALGAEPVLDPELWPQGPQEGDRLRLLGVLLAKTELEITAATRLGEDEQFEDIADVVLGWTEQVGSSGIASNVLVNRLQRTAVQLMDGGEEKTAAGQVASGAAVVAAADVLSAHLQFEHGDVERTRRALDRTEASVIAVLEGMHEVRVAIGDVEE
ncbi:hypothetical protein [Streptomyces sp. NPDC058678]|uniref:hypothetical protein n=1 Tax=Streptomyces sp. NPDC058678 TaxID=3346595 RepID=UPI003661CB2C